MYKTLGTFFSFSFFFKFLVPLLQVHSIHFCSECSFCRSGSDPCWRDDKKALLLSPGGFHRELMLDHLGPRRFLGLATTDGHPPLTLALVGF